MFDKKENLINIFIDTEKSYNNKNVLKESIENTKKNTKLYLAGNTPDISSAIANAGADAKVIVSKKRSFEAAFDLKEKYPDSRIAVHNFASATNPGGGVKRGSSAQEECLCRSSTLYPCINTKYLWDNYYWFHRNLHDLRYTDACIYSPDVTIFKDDSAFPKMLPESKWINVDILTCAAPNLRLKPYNSMNPGEGTAIKVTDKELLDIHKKRAKHMLSIAVTEGVDVLVLGAFGCGAFANKPEIVARAYKEVLPEFKRYFKEIEFAVYCSPKDTKNFETFNRWLK